jgi:hypothetical protein
MHLLHYRRLQERARGILGDPSALISRSAFHEFAALVIKYTRRLVHDAIRLEEERRWTLLMSHHKRNIIHTSSLTAALQMNGYTVEEDADH